MVNGDESNGQQCRLFGKSLLHVKLTFMLDILAHPVDVNKSIIVNLLPGVVLTLLLLHHTPSTIYTDKIIMTLIKDNNVKMNRLSLQHGHNHWRIGYKLK